MALGPVLTTNQNAERRGDPWPIAGTHLVGPRDLYFRPSSALDLRRTAIHEQLHAIHKARIARSQEQRYRRNLLRSPDFAARNQRLELLLCFCPQRIQNRRSDRSPAQDIHPYLSFL